MLLRAGSHLGPYEVLKLLDKGGMGQVYRARDPRLGRDVAVKVITSESAPSAERLRRFEDEARAAGALNHPNVLSVFDVGSEGGVPYVVFELLEGETLRARLRGGPIPPGGAVDYAIQACRGLAACHEKGILHRDLKPENLFITADGRVKILDFGLAKLTQEGGGPADTEARTLTAPSVRMGTLVYMSPEQLRGQPVDALSDIFSLGVVLHEMLSGRAPFRRDSDADTVSAILNEEPPALATAGLPPALVEIVHRCLNKQPADRFQTARDLGFGLGQVVTSGSVPSPPPATPARRYVAWSALAVIGLLALGAGVMARRLPPPSPPPSIAVLVPEPRIASEAPDERSRFAAFAVKAAILRSLTGLEGIDPVSPDELPAGTLSPADAARAVAADELVTSTIVCAAESCRVSLRRQGARDAHIARDSGPFDVPSEPEDSLLLTRAVEIQVREVFSGHRPPAQGDDRQVRPADYERYLAFRRRAEAGEALDTAAVDQLQQIARSSPGLSEADALAADLARLQGDDARAQSVLLEARGRHPDDPLIAYARAQLEAVSGRVADAEAAVAELERVAPGDIRVWRARAVILRQGDFKAATEVHRRLLAARPSWKNLWYLADVEIRINDAQAARRHLDQLLQVSPGNRHGLTKKAELEWRMGDPAQAVRIYERLLEDNVSPIYLTNLGWSLMLAGRYSEAARTYDRALTLEPDELLTRMNLGVASEGAGEAEKARRLYRDLLARIAQREHTGQVTVRERLLKAQALARLGQFQPAVELTLQVLGEGERDAQTVYQAAVIFALCGEQNNAMVQAREARRLGLSPHWFGLPGFDSLRAVPAFRELVGLG
jgi:tetratricopeptide (TPR) repeat protein